MLRNLLVLLLAIMLSIVLFGCEGEQGPEGPAGPQGEQGPPGEDGQDGEDFTQSPYTYLGNDGGECQHCHFGKVSTWMDTHHAEAYDDLVADGNETNPYCVQCHTTGWDAEVTYGDTTVTSPGPDLYGFDDYFGKDDEESVARREELANVQCEACHGAMGPVGDFGVNHAEYYVGTYIEDGEFISTCFPCHERQLEEWSESGHAMAADGDLELFREEHYAGGSCGGCHTSEGYIQRFDGDWATADFTGEYTFIGCTACHDPHSPENEFQLRATGTVYVEYHLGYDPEEGGDDGVMTGYGAGQTCAQCHHARRDTDNVLGQIENGYGHFGPHGSPQMDMFLGWGCYEIDGYDYDRVVTHQSAVTDACVSCHMVRKEELHGNDAEHIFHQFSPQGAACTPCHTELDPDDFDRNGVQTATEDLMNELAGLFGYADWEAFVDHDTGWDNQADGVTPEERMAAYALVFVINDGSRGIHNSAYSHDLLQNAIDFMNE